ncbi:MULTISPECIES: mitofilin family membrane protein [Rhodomicrobium]|uniref:COG4223 family protein n=1 Tax=Rhodomicrobium TaxID=1068 RepID=UPI000B4B873C|nr:MULTISPECIES: mitofilin family membrane protein [Rhodomicrobium]
MTGNNGPERDDPVNAGNERRPHATLDLQAEEIPARDNPSADAAETAGGAQAASLDETPGDPEAASPLEAASADEAPDAAEAAGASETASAPEPAAPRAERPDYLRHDAPAEDLPPHPAETGGHAFASHMASGALGALLALIVAYFAFAANNAPAPFTADDAQMLRARLAAIEGRLNDTAARTEQLSSGSQTNGLKNDLAALNERIGRIEGRPAAAPGISPDAVQDSVQHSLDPLNARIAELEARLGSVVKAQSEVQTNGKATALAVALYNLRRAADEGRPFAAELQSVADMTPVPLDLSTLESRRDEGVRSLEQLQSAFNASANAAIDAENQPADDSFASSLWSKAKSFIRVRRKGDVPGDDTRAILARIEHRLATGDLPSAIEESGRLQGPAATAMVRWLGELKAKQATDEALARVEARLLTALGGEEQAKRGG